MRCEVWEERNIRGMEGGYGFFGCFQCERFKVWLGKVLYGIFGKSYIRFDKIVKSFLKDIRIKIVIN